MNTKIGFSSSLRTSYLDSQVLYISQHESSSCELLASFIRHRLQVALVLHLLLESHVSPMHSPIHCFAYMYQASLGNPLRTKKKNSPIYPIFSYTPSSPHTRHKTPFSMHKPPPASRRNGGDKIGLLHQPLATCASFLAV